MGAAFWVRKFLQVNWYFNMFYESLKEQRLKSNSCPCSSGLYICGCLKEPDVLYSAKTFFCGLVIPGFFLVLLWVVKHGSRRIQYYLFPGCQGLDSWHCIFPAEISNVRAYFWMLVTSGWLWYVDPQNCFSKYSIYW